MTTSSGAAEPACANPISGAGRYLIPGLWDMHVHGTRLDRQGIDAPRIYLASPLIDGRPVIWPRSPWWRQLHAAVAARDIQAEDRQ